MDARDPKDTQSTKVSITKLFMNVWEFSTEKLPPWAKMFAVLVSVGVIFLVLAIGLKTGLFGFLVASGVATLIISAMVFLLNMLVDMDVIE